MKHDIGFGIFCGVLVVAVLYLGLGLTAPKSRLFRYMDNWLFNSWLDLVLGVTYAFAYTFTYATIIAREASAKALADKKKYNEEQSAAEQKEAVKF